MISESIRRSSSRGPQCDNGNKLCLRLLGSDQFTHGRHGNASSRRTCTSLSSFNQQVQWALNRDPTLQIFCIFDIPVDERGIIDGTAIDDACRILSEEDLPDREFELLAR